MKKFAWIAIVAAGLLGCKNSNTENSAALSPDQLNSARIDSANFTSIDWLDSTALKLGPVKKGENVEVAYRFRNSGDKQLVITNVTAGCGCTVPEKPEKPFSPGQEGVIKALFNSAGQHPGPHTKYVTVEANTLGNTVHQLSFTVEVTE